MILIKRIALLVIIFVLGLSASVLAAEPGKGIIKGQVINGTEGSSSVANQEITLNISLNNTEVDSNTTKTDAEGHFVFEGLSTEADYSYQVILTFQQAEYYSDWLSFDDSETIKFTEVTVYDSTTNGDAITLTIAHTVIYVEENNLWITEYSLFVNESDHTYIGSKEITTDGTREILRFSLPKETTDLQLEYGLMECCIYSSEDGFVDTMPVLPGDKEVVYSYRVDYNAGAYTFSRNVNYPILSYALLVQGDEGSKVISDQLTTEEPLFIEDTLFKHLSGRDFAPGDILVAQLSGLPATNNQGTAKWVALTLVVVTGGFGFFYLAKRRRVQPVRPVDSLDQRQQRLLVELAQLDNDFEDGKIPEEVYRRRRAVRKAQLVELRQRLKEESGNR